MAHEASSMDAVDLVFNALRDLELEPKLVPHGRIDELRGGRQCFDLKAGEGIDSAILISKMDYDPFSKDKSRTLYKVDYSIRGTIKGVLPWRIISRTTLKLKGLVRKRLVWLRWETPSEDRGGGHDHLRLGAEGLPPAPGELWEGGPHQMLTERLNGDAELQGTIKTFMEGGRRTPLPLSIVSDRWGESIRICGVLWIKARDLPSVYTTPVYLGIVARVCRHLSAVRRIFGGLTF